VDLEAGDDGGGGRVLAMRRPRQSCLEGEVSRDEARKAWWRWGPRRRGRRRWGQGEDGGEWPRTR